MTIANLTVSDAELLRRSRRDPELFGVLYRRHVTAIHRYHVRELRDGQVAADLTAETFAQAWLHAGRFRDEADGSALPWLFGIAANLARAYRRDQRLDQQALRRLGLPRTVSIDGEFERVDDRDEAAGFAAQIRAGLARLPASQREVVRLRVVEGLTFEEIGQRVGCSATLARVRTWRGLRVLREGTTR
jgi:RNA polymerase sigma factor (sigma-70 family)